MTVSGGNFFLPLSAHSQIARTRHPSAWSFRMARRSTNLFRPIFFLQNPVLVAGQRKRWQLCPCQKQPCTKITE